MRHRILSSLFAIVVFGGLFLNPMPVQIIRAANAPCVPQEAESISGDISIQGIGGVPTISFAGDTLTVSLNNLAKDGSSNEYEVLLYPEGWPVAGATSGKIISGQTKSQSFTLDLTKIEDVPGRPNWFKSMDLKLNINGNEVCQIADVNLDNYKMTCSRMEVEQTRPVLQPDGSTSDLLCKSNVPPECVSQHPLKFTVKGLKFKNGNSVPTSTSLCLIVSTAWNDVGCDAYGTPNAAGDVEFPATPAENPGVYSIRVQDPKKFDVEGGCSGQSFSVISGCPADSCSQEDPPDTIVTPAEKTEFSLCSQLKKGSTEEASCEKCLGQNGVWTAIGCISAEPEQMIAHFIRLGIGLGGGVALLMTLIGGFLMTTSQGNPKQQEQAKEMITSAVIGLLFVLFSVVLLQFIGVTILQIPGFGGASNAGTP